MTMISQVGTAALQHDVRAIRCAPTLRLTRWSALSTVLQSQSSFSPIAV